MCAQRTAALTLASKLEAEVGLKHAALTAHTRALAEAMLASQTGPGVPSTALVAAAVAAGSAAGGVDGGVRDVTGGGSGSGVSATVPATTSGLSSAVQLLASHQLAGATSASAAQQRPAPSTVTLVSNTSLSQLVDKCKVGAGLVGVLKAGSASTVCLRNPVC